MCQVTIKDRPYDTRRPRRRAHRISLATTRTAPNFATRLVGCLVELRLMAAVCEVHAFKLRV